MPRGSSLVPVVALTLATACGVSIDLDGAGVRGSGVSETERRSVEAFDRVDVGGNIDVEIEVGPATGVTLTGDDNLLPIVETEVREGTLHLRPREEVDPRAGMRATITTPSLEAASIGGSGEVRIRGVRADAFDAGVRGSGSMVADGSFGDLTVEVSGSGELALSGSADRVDALVTGSGEIDLVEVRARTAHVRVTGSGDASIHATDSVDARVSGSGEVRYAGDPAVWSHVSGSGKVRPSSR